MPEESLSCDVRQPTHRCPHFRRLLLALITLLIFAGLIALILLLVLPRRYAAPETNSIAVLKVYHTAQGRFFRKHGVYARSLGTLAQEGMISPLIALADKGTLAGSAVPHKKYYHALIRTRNGKPMDPAKEFYLMVAWPAVYEESGINTYVVDPDGTVWMKDLYGNPPPTDAAAVDSTWLIP